MRRASFPLPFLLLLVALLAACNITPPTFEGNLTGQVLTTNGDGVPGATVTATSVAADGPSAESLRPQAVDATNTDANGYFDLTLPEGRYALTVTGDGVGARRIVDVGSDRVEVNLTAEALGHVRGTVVEEDGGEAEGVRVRAKGTNWSALTTEGGEYLLKGLPIGEYTLVAEDDGYASEGIVVTVETGTTIDAPTLTLVSTVPVPTIESAGGPYLFVDEMGLSYGLEPTTLTITGSGFGDAIGLSQVRYAGMMVNSDLITEWSDTRISLEFRHPLELFMPFMPFVAMTAKDEGLVPVDEQRFEIRTEGGVAVSESVRFAIVDPYVESTSTPGAKALVDIAAFDLFENPLVGMELTLDATRGTIGTTSLVLDADGYAETTLETTEVLLPHVVSVRYDGEVVAQENTMCCRVDVSPYEVPADEASTLALTVKAYDHMGVPDATFDVQVIQEPSSPFDAPEAIIDASYATDESGLITVDLPALPSGGRYTVLLMEDGAIVGDNVFYVDGDETAE